MPYNLVTEDRQADPGGIAACRGWPRERGKWIGLEGCPHGDQVNSITLLPEMAAILLWAAPCLEGAEPSYFRDIRPVLQRQCQGCHQPNMKSSNLDLTTYEGLSVGGKRGPAAPLLVKYITGDLQPRMPMGQPALTGEQVALVREWVAAGAKDDTPAEARTGAGDGPVVYTQAPVITA